MTFREEEKMQQMTGSNFQKGTLILIFLITQTKEFIEKYFSFYNCQKKVSSLNQGKYYLKRVVKMIWNLLQALTAFYILVKGVKQYRKLQKIYLKLKQTPIINVSEIKELLKNKPSSQKVFAIVKGITQAKSKSGQNDILSIVKTKPLRLKPFILNSLEKNRWGQILQKYDWRRPRDLKKMQFGLKDLIRDQALEVTNCQKSNISGALSQIYSDKIIYQPTKNAVARFFKQFYNLLTSFLPFKLFLNRTKLGEEIQYFGILEGQFLLAIGQVSKTSQGQIKIQNPYYLTKQKAFIEKKMRIKMNYLYWILFFIGVIKVYVLYQIGKKLIKMNWKKNGKRAIEMEGEDRSQDEGDFANCIICYTSIRSIVLKPCRHYGFCYDCYLAFKEKGCPICKNEITGIIRIIKKKQ